MIYAIRAIRAIRIVVIASSSSTQSPRDVEDGFSLRHMLKSFERHNRQETHGGPGVTSTADANNTTGAGSTALRGSLGA